MPISLQRASLDWTSSPLFCPGGMQTFALDSSLSYSLFNILQWCVFLSVNTAYSKTVQNSTYESKKRERECVCIIERESQIVWPDYKICPGTSLQPLTHVHRVIPYPHPFPMLYQREISFNSLSQPPPPPLKHTNTHMHPMTDWLTDWLTGKTSTRMWV